MNVRTSSSNEGTPILMITAKQMNERDDKGEIVDGERNDEGSRSVQVFAD